ncbi:MAG: helix-turn-helix transcriptional regulator [Polyangiaceae bacterium]|nr:helix-turn-helix transcriptional regulator [Polyangiaceae bacterium]
MLAKRRARILDLLDHVYAGVLDASRWPHALESLVGLFGASSAAVRVEQPGAAFLRESYGIDQAAKDAYARHYWRLDPWAKTVWDTPAGVFGHGDVICPRARVEHSAYHVDYALRHGFGALAAGFLERSPARVVTLGVLRDPRRGDFEASVATVGSLLTPHFARSFALRDAVAARDGGAITPGLRLEEALRARYHLTIAEARIAVRVGTGRAPKEVAAELGTSWNTVRSQLRVVFAKLQVDGQSGLARRLTLLELELSRARGLGAVPP